MALVSFVERRANTITVLYLLNLVMLLVVLSLIIMALFPWTAFQIYIYFGEILVFAITNPLLLGCSVMLLTILQWVFIFLMVFKLPAFNIRNIRKTDTLPQHMENYQRYKGVILLAKTGTSSSYYPTDLEAYQMEEASDKLLKTSPSDQGETGGSTAGSC